MTTNETAHAFCHRHNLCQCATYTCKPHTAACLELQCILAVQLPPQLAPIDTQAYAQTYDSLQHTENAQRAPLTPLVSDQTESVSAQVAAIVRGRP